MWTATRATGGSRRRCTWLRATTGPGLYSCCSPTVLMFTPRTRVAWCHCTMLAAMATLRSWHVKDNKDCKENNNVSKDKITKLLQTEWQWQQKNNIINFQVTELLITHGANVNAMDLWQFTPLHEAASKSRTEVKENIPIEYQLLWMKSFEVHEPEWFRGFLFIELHRYVQMCNFKKKTKCNRLIGSRMISCTRWVSE